MMWGSIPRSFFFFLVNFQDLVLFIIYYEYVERKTAPIGVLPQSYDILNRYKSRYTCSTTPTEYDLRKK